MLEVQPIGETVGDVLGEPIRSRRAKVGVVGLGYLGLPLAVEFARAGFTVTGLDVTLLGRRGALVT
jgi:UDP-N-acetyl-D-glucosamine dehydrogenase